MGVVGIGLGASSGGASAFTPTDIPGLVEWLKADALALSDNDPVSTWTASTGTNATATGSGRPTFKTGIINSLPVVRFDGVANTMTIARSATIEPVNVTVFAVVRGSPITAFTNVMGKHHAGAGHVSYGLNKGASADVALRALTQNATTGSVVGGAISIDAYLWNGNAHVVGLTADGSTLVGFVEGVGSSVAAVGNLQYDSGDLYLGSFGGTLNFAAFDFAELLIYNTALSAADRWRVLGYLGNKWAVP